MPGIFSFSVPGLSSDEFGCLWPGFFGTHFFLQVWCLGANAMSMLMCTGDRTSGHAVGFPENQCIMSLVVKTEQQVMETLLPYNSRWIFPYPKHSICMYHYHVAIISLFVSCYIYWWCCPWTVIGTNTPSITGKEKKTQRNAVLGPCHTVRHFVFALEWNYF